VESLSYNITVINLNLQKAAMRRKSKDAIAAKNGVRLIGS
jgi:hypothetical protein